MTHKFGWKKQLADHRDFCFSPLHTSRTLPPSVDLRPQCPPVVDQGQLGSCTANAIAAAHEFAQMKQLEKAFPPSRLFIYYNERAMEGTIKSDAGAVIRDGFKSISKQGVCDEKLCKYNIAKFAIKPSSKAYKEALKHKAVQYLAITPTIDDLRGCLADGLPFVFGISVYASFENVGADGLVPMPLKDEQLLGGHAITCVGYDDATRRFTVRNSWGPSWADKGYCYFSYDYLTNGNLSSDFWCCKLVA